MSGPTRRNGSRRVVAAADVAPEEVTWLWPPYIPLGKVTILEGDPGVGKSWITLALAAAATTGSGLPGLSRQAPATVLIINGEDGPGDTIRPRLETLGANLERSHIAEDLTNPLTLDGEGLDWLHRCLDRLGASFVVIDPFSAFVGRGVDMHRANETRSVLAPLGNIATETGAAILIVRHLTKSQGAPTLYRGAGSVDVLAAARSVLLAGADPQDPHRRALVQIKNNLAPLGEAIGYAIENGAFSWTGISDLTALDLVAPYLGPEERTALGHAKAFLEEALAEGPRRAREIYRLADEAGVAKRTLQRAKREHGVEAQRHGFGSGGYYEWSLPTHGAPTEAMERQGRTLAVHGDHGDPWAEAPSEAEALANLFEAFPAAEVIDQGPGAGPAPPQAPTLSPSLNGGATSVPESTSPSPRPEATRSQTTPPI